MSKDKNKLKSEFLLSDAKTYKSKLYHIYEHVKDDLNRKAQEQEPLPQLVSVGYYLLGRDWLEAAKAWKERKTKIEPVIDKKEFAISWPNIIRIDHVFRPELRLDLNKTTPLELNAYETPMLVQMAPIIDGKPDVTKVSAIDLEELGKKFRWQKIVFEQASQVYDQMRPGWKGNKEYLLAQLIRLVEQFISSGKIDINPPLFNQDDLRRRILITLNMSKAVQHIWESIIPGNTECRIPIFDTERPILSTGDMRTWFTGKPCEYTERSHINFCVYDSTWEAAEAFELDRNPNVAAWVKNDHLGFEVLYIYQGVVHKYRPDFLIRLKNGTMLVLETKGQESDQDKTKRASLDEWAKAVNEHGEFGMWTRAVSRSPGDLKEILYRTSN